MRFVPAPDLPDDDRRVRDLEQLGILDTDPEECFDRLTRLAAVLTGAPISLVSLVDDRRQWFKSRQGLGATETPRDISFCGHAIAHDELFVVPDATLDERFADNPLVLGDPFIRFYAGAPLVNRNGSRLGTLCVIDTEPREGLTTEQAEGLCALAQVVVDELEYRATAASLAGQRAELDRYQALWGATSDLMGLAEVGGRVLSLNPAGRRLLGIGPEEELDGLEISSIHSPETSEGYMETAISFVKRIGYWRGESELISRAGVRIPVDQVILAHRDETGAVTHLSTVCRDLSERDEISRLNQLQVMKDTFVSTVSHELRTPLTSISVALAMLTDDLEGSLDEDSMQMMRIARANAERLTALVDDILDLERTELGDRVLNFKVVTVEDIVSPALASVEGASAVTGARIEVENLVDPNQRVVCAPDRISRVLVNLLTNAIKYSGIGSTIQLGVRLESADEITFSVRDDGIGIREESIPHLFDPFWQADSSASRTVQGSGLGLAICRRIVEKHGGHFDVESTFGEGSTFSFTIPIT